MGNASSLRYAAALALTLASPATASDWVLLDTWSNGITIQVDRESMLVEGDNVTVWVKLRGLTDGPARMAIYRATYSCRDRTIGVRLTERFNASGASLGGTSAILPEQRPIPPDTADDVVLHRICPNLAPPPHQ